MSDKKSKKTTSATGRWRIIARHPNGLPVYAGPDTHSDISYEEAVAAVKAVMAARLTGRRSAKK